MSSARSLENWLCPLRSHKATPRQQQRMIANLSSPVTPSVRNADPGKIQLLGYIRYKSCQMVFRQPFL
jgi:hypothetical protein